MPLPLSSQTILTAPHAVRNALAKNEAVVRPRLFAKTSNVLRGRTSQGSAPPQRYSKNSFLPLRQTSLRQKLANHKRNQQLPAVQASNPDKEDSGFAESSPPEYPGHLQ